MCLHRTAARYFQLVMSLQSLIKKKIFRNAVQGQTHVLVPEYYFYKQPAPATRVACASRVVVTPLIHRNSYLSL